MTSGEVGEHPSHNQLGAQVVEDKEKLARPDEAIHGPTTTRRWSTPTPSGEIVGDYCKTFRLAWNHYGCPQIYADDDVE